MSARGGSDIHRVACKKAKRVWRPLTERQEQRRVKKDGFYVVGDTREPHLLRELLRLCRAAVHVRDVTAGVGGRHDHRQAFTI